MKKSGVITIILGFVVFSWRTQATEIYKPFWPHRFDMYLESQYFKTDSNFDIDGNKQSLGADLANPDGYSFQSINLQTVARYLFFHDLGIYSGINFGNVESHNPLNTGTNSLLNYLIIGADYQIVKEGALSLYGDVSYWLSNESIDINTNDAITSNGASEFKTIVVGVADLGKFKNFVKLGYAYRTAGLSSLVHYGAGAELSVKKFAIGTSVDGLSSVTDDQNTDRPELRDLVTDRVNAGSRRYYSVNPNQLEIELYFSYRIDPSLKFKISGGSSILGANSANGYFAGLALNWSFGGLNGFGLNNSYDGDLENMKKDEKKFKIDTEDGVNQELFQPVVPIKPVEKTKSSPVEVKRKKPVKKSL